MGISGTVGVFRGLQISRMEQGSSWKFVVSRNDTGRVPYNTHELTRRRDHGAPYGNGVAYFFTM